MPSEQPRQPLESYERLLRHGASKGLPLQAFEVAHTGDNPRFVNAVRLIAGVCIIAITIIVSAYR